MNSILKTIITSAWVIRENAALGYMPLVDRMMSGITVDLTELKSTAQSNQLSGDAGKIVAVIPVQDVITKNDFCGEMGTVSIDRKLKEFIADDSIGAVILDMDTPGGEASYLENVSNTIFNSTKPIIAYYSGQCCSGGYYMASNCTAIFASAKSDEIGSIGTMVSFYGPNLKKQAESTYVLHTVYATKSTDKNLPYREGIKGKYDLIRTSMLDPINEIFHEQVLRGRPDVSKEVFTGSVYFAEDAIDLGLIDGIKSFEEVVQYAFDLIDSDMWPFNKQQKQKSKMEHLEKFSAILGREITDVSQLSADDWAKVSAQLPGTAPETTTDPAAEQTAPPAAATATADLAKMITESVTAAVAPINAEIGTMKTQLAKIGGQPGAGVTTDPITNGDGKEAVELLPWENPNSSINQKADRDLGKA